MFSKREKLVLVSYAIATWVGFFADSIVIMWFGATLIYLVSMLCDIDS